MYSSYKFVIKLVTRLTASLVLFLLAGCANTEKSVQPVNFSSTSTPKKLAVFFDGTNNDEASRTNVSKLHSLVSLQDRSDIHTIYVQGVGTGGENESILLGMALGTGIERDVLQAYQFLVNRHNNPNDEIYIFGFSRGAHAARILAGLLEVAGLPSEILNEEELDDIWDGYKGDRPKQDKIDAIEEVLGAKRNQVKVTFMGLWDTVEALGSPDYEEVWDKAPVYDEEQYVDFGGRITSQYEDQLCNVEKAAHALSIDDFRAKTFTPTLLTYPELTYDCPTVDIHSVVDEVWFSGAHSDVGGGYHDTELDGVSLNWMLSKLQPYQLLPHNTRVFDNRMGKSHNARSNFFLGLFYGRRNRHLPGYLGAGDYPNQRLPVHESVFDRLENGPGKEWFEFNWSGAGNFSQCFESLDGGKARDCQSIQCNLRLKKDQQCFEVIHTTFAENELDQSN